MPDPGARRQPQQAHSAALTHDRPVGRRGRRGSPKVSPPSGRMTCDAGANNTQWGKDRPSLQQMVLGKRGRLVQSGKAGPLRHHMTR